jgi:predicted DNA-binding ribbon-helix-helix protein
MDDPDTARKSAPAEAPERARYDRDLYGWAIEQAALLRAGRLDQVDALNLAEEIDDVGNEQYDKLESAIRVILLHLLKWDRQQQRRSRFWTLSIAVHRKRALRVLQKNPGLKPKVDEAVVEAYETARLEAASQTLLEEDAFPLECPYSWNDIMERQVRWPPAD